MCVNNQFRKLIVSHQFFYGSRKMKKKVLLIFCFIFVFCLGFVTNMIINGIVKSKAPIFMKWIYNEDGNLGVFSFNDNNGLNIFGTYNSIGLESLNICDDNKNYTQTTVFGKTYDGSIESPNPPEPGELIEIDSFLTRSEFINNHEIRYYIDNSENPKIVMENNLE